MSKRRATVQCMLMVVVGVQSLVLAAKVGPSPTSADRDPVPPTPDFKTRIDFVDWYQKHMLLPDDQSAYQGYAPFRDAMKSTPQAVFAGPDAKAAFAAWDPVVQKQWEKSTKATQQLRELFSRAAQDPRLYVAPILFAKDQAEDQRMLMNITLPDLSSFRTMTKSMLAQSWRAEKGAVSPVQMCSAWRTCLGNVRQVAGGDHLIQKLVAIGERNLVEEHARWALYQGVFKTPKQLETAYTILCESDPPLPGAERFVCLEHAGALEWLQAMFLPESPGGKPGYSPERLMKRLGLDKQSEAALKAKLPSSASLADGQAAIKIAEEYFRELVRLIRTGYPKARAADTEEFYARSSKDSPLAGVLLHSYSRPYQTMARAQASRRATLLVYAVHLHKARTGDWPASLDKLSDLLPGVLIDPFTGSAFVYRVSADGPRIYSCSENGKDDGGVHSPRWGDGADTGGSDDYVFWPPQKQ